MMSEPTQKGQKTKEEILAERKAKKKNKAAAKNKSKAKDEDDAKSGGNSGLSKLPANEDNPAEPIAAPIIKNDVLQNQEILLGALKEIKSNKNVGGDERNVDLKTLAQKSDLISEGIQNLSIGSGEKSKAQLRAERRQKQEAQRAKKLEKGSAVQLKQQSSITDASKVEMKTVKAVTSAKPKVLHQVKLFAHLYVDSKRDESITVHPIITCLGTQYNSRIVSGSNVRCLALLNAMKKVVNDFETPENQEFSRGLEAEVTKSMAYLNRCRPIAVSMVNAVKHLKLQINNLKGSEEESKIVLKEWIDTYIKEQLETAAEAICISVRKKISDGDVILTYGFSSLIQRILISAHKEKVHFRVIVVDGRPWLEGKEMLRKLVRVGIHCTYLFVNGLSFIMPEVTKILLGAHALLTNGYVMSRAGSSQIALLAKTYNVPVLVCCETHKFSERVQTDSIVYNELGNPDDLVSSKGCCSKGLSKWKQIPYLTPLNLTYDVTPPDLVSAVVTEIAVLPCTSVPVILRLHL